MAKRAKGRELNTVTIKKGNEQNFTKDSNIVKSQKNAINKIKPRKTTLKKVASVFLNVGLGILVASFVWFPYLLIGNIVDIGLWDGIVNAFNISKWMFLGGLASAIAGSIFGGELIQF